MPSFRTCTRLALRLGTSRFTAAAATASLSVALAACGSPPSTTASTGDAGDLTGQECCVISTSGPTVNGIATAHDGWDIAFINWTVPHDAVASQMAVLAAAQAGSQQLKDLATKIDAVQGPRYQKMAAMAAAWSQPVPSTDPNAAKDAHDHGGLSDGKSDPATLVPLSGAAFDKQLLTLMIAHHQAALPVAQATIDNGMNEQAKQLAKEILSTATAEISQMQQMLRTL